eukprot:GILK01001991.1.p1 GENE.GILK01001991.1~~GILK01001991.1.p1  ORF type:complete len:396 (+),score=20.40 GILK01001991.1:34-1221(+)
MSGTKRMMLMARVSVCVTFFLLCVIPLCCAATSNSLSDCLVVAAKFNNTCTSTSTAAASVSAIPAKSVTCTVGTTLACAGTTSGSGSSKTCTFDHKLCVTCAEVNGIARIRVQSNGLPARCPNVPSASTISEQNIDFTVNFNPEVTVNATNTSPTSQTEVNSAVCTTSAHQTVPTASSFTCTGTCENTLFAVAIDGTSILNPNSANDVDPFYPSPTSVATEMVDSCLSHTQVSGIYHYHTMSSCQLSSNYPSGAINPCAGTAACNNQISSYMLSGFANQKNLTVLGLAKDGHVLFGPYLADGTQVTTGLDVCNGRFYDSNQNYAYFATDKFPYTSGCWGPGTYPSYYPTCSTNAISSYTQSCYATNTCSGASAQSVSWTLGTIVMVVAVLTSSYQ